MNRLNIGLCQRTSHVELADIVYQSEPRTRPLYIHFPFGDQGESLRNAEAVWDVSRVLIHYMRRVREVVYGFAFHPVAGRLARLLLSHYSHVDDRPAPAT